MALCFVLSTTLKSLTQLHIFSAINGIRRNSIVLPVIYIRRELNFNMSDKKNTKDKDKPSSTSSSSREDEDDRESSSGFSVESLRRYLADKLGFYVTEDEKTEAQKILEDLTFDGLMKHWKEKGFKKIITMVGAGISTSAGIPDFRSPGSGLYHNLEKYNLPHPTAIFQMDYFYENPKPFFVLAKELYPGSFKPTPCHYFVKLLNEKGWLLRHYTQNIDTLERVAGIPDDKIVEAHGTFYTNHCLECRKKFSMEWMKEQIFDDVVPTCDDCNGVIKPDIVFFGENLPDKFHMLPSKDFKECDLLIIMGTSLEVQPFASLVDRTNNKCLRLLINREKVGKKQDLLSSFLLCGGGLSFDEPDNKTDIAWIGDCDDGVQAIADAIGIGDELKEMVKAEHAKIDEQIKAEKDSKKSKEGSSKET